MLPYLVLANLAAPLVRSCYRRPARVFWCRSGNIRTELFPIGRLSCHLVMARVGIIHRISVCSLYVRMTYDARALANYLLDYGSAKQQPVTIMSLLKILFFAHAWYLAKTGMPLCGQPFEAWPYGPVNRVVYDQFRGIGAKPITSRAKALNLASAKYEIATWETVDPDAAALLRNVFDYYSQYHPFRLSALTHARGAPWDEVWNEATRRAVPGMVISNDSIRDWFQINRPTLMGADDGWIS
jgi:uncharacterized phage-associated protein